MNANNVLVRGRTLCFKREMCGKGLTTINCPQLPWVLTQHSCFVWSFVWICKHSLQNFMLILLWKIWRSSERSSKYWSNLITRRNSENNSNNNHDWIYYHRVDNHKAIVEDGITIKPPHVYYSQQLTVAEREVKKAKRIANKCIARKCMNLSNIKGNMIAKSTMNIHKKEHELFILFLYKYENQLPEDDWLDFKFALLINYTKSLFLFSCQSVD